MYAVSEEEEEGEDKLEGGKGYVCGEEEGWCGAGGEDGEPDFFEEVGHFLGGGVGCGVFVGACAVGCGYGGRVGVERSGCI